MCVLFKNTVGKTVIKYYHKNIEGTIQLFHSFSMQMITTYKFYFFLSYKATINLKNKVSFLMLQ